MNPRDKMEPLHDRDACRASCLLTHKANLFFHLWVTLREGACVCVYGRYCGNDSPGGSPAWDPLVSPPVSPLGACSPFAPAQSPPQHAALHATTARAHPFGAAWLAEGRSGAAPSAAARGLGHYDEPSPHAVVYL